jgi:hypothetical protein
MKSIKLESKPKVEKLHIKIGLIDECPQPIQTTIRIPKIVGNRGLTKAISDP